jgi:hypothetical protein
MGLSATKEYVIRSYAVNQLLLTRYNVMGSETIVP